MLVAHTLHLTGWKSPKTIADQTKTNKIPKAMGIISKMKVKALASMA